MNDSLVYLTAALLPLAAGLLVIQVNPYRALVIRGILGAVAALLYTIQGAADVALTEALLGTLLVVMLYAVAIRSSMVFRLGVLSRDASGGGKRTPAAKTRPAGLVAELRAIFSRRHMRVQLIRFGSPEAMQRALSEKKVHAILAPDRSGRRSSDGTDAAPSQYRIDIRVRRIYDILTTDLTPSAISLRYVGTAETGKAHS